MSKTKYTNSARLPEIFGAFGLVTIYKNCEVSEAPNGIFTKCGAKILQIFEICKLYFTILPFFFKISPFLPKMPYLTQNHSLQVETSRLLSFASFAHC